MKTFAEVRAPHWHALSYHRGCTVCSTRVCTRMPCLAPHDAQPQFQGYKAIGELRVAHTHFCSKECAQYWFSKRTLG